MNMNRLISMLVRQLMNVGIRKGISMASVRGAKKSGGSSVNPTTGAGTKQAVKIARRTMR
ncbi:hypothetical protein [Yoonia sp.]|uniref:hypothetical protein n=1 Tax=Yoonia sp. TaxID=2212373 RepID=UPI003A4D7DB1